MVGPVAAGTSEEPTVVLDPALLDPVVLKGTDEAEETPDVLEEPFAMVVEVVSVLATATEVVWAPAVCCMSPLPTTPASNKLSMPKRAVPSPCTELPATKIVAFVFRGVFNLVSFNASAIKPNIRQTSTTQVISSILAGETSCWVAFRRKREDVTNP